MSLKSVLFGSFMFYCKPYFDDGLNKAKCIQPLGNPILYAAKHKIVLLLTQYNMALFIS